MKILDIEAANQLVNSFSDSLINDDKNRFDVLLAKAEEFNIDVILNDKLLIDSNEFPSYQITIHYNSISNNCVTALAKITYTD